MKLFYHGTTVAGIKELASASNVVYLTPNKAYALFYIRDTDINWVTCGVTKNGIVQYDEQFPNQLPIVYNGISGYIYSCRENAAFEKSPTNDVWICKNPVSVDSAEYIHNVYDEIIKYEKSGDVNIIRYETLTDYKKLDIYDMMVHYIFKNNLLDSSSNQAEFIKKNFPDAWNEVKTHPENRQMILENWERKINKIK